MSLASDLVLINMLNKEIAYRLKEQSSIPRNSEAEFVDLRSVEDFKQSHFHLFMNMDITRPPND